LYSATGPGIEKNVKIGITGATGFVGGHLAVALSKEGHQVRTLVRHPLNQSVLHGVVVEVHLGDIRSCAGLDGFVKDLDVIIHCAAITSAPYRKDLADVNVTGTSRLLTACQKHAPGLKRFVFISSMEVMGLNASPTQPFAEKCEPQPMTAYGYSKYKAEAKVASSGLPYTILRPAPVYGPRDRDLRSFFDAAARRIHLLAAFPNRLSVLYIENLVYGISEVMLHKATVNKTYFIADSNGPITWAEISRMLEKHYGKSRVCMPVFSCFIWASAALNTALSIVSGTRNILNLDKARLLTSSNLSISVEQAEHDFSYKPPYSTEEGMLRTAIWYDNHPDE